jgi:VanZ family protein
MNWIKKYLGKKYIAISWTILIFILLALPGSVLPREKAFTIPQFDKLVHIGLFSCFVFLWCLYFSKRNLPQKKLLGLFFWIFVIAAFYGAGMEFVQKYFIPGRDFEVGDILADLMGASLAYGTSNILLLGIE